MFPITCVMQIHTAICCKQKEAVYYNTSPEISRLVHAESVRVHLQKNDLKDLKLICTKPFQSHGNIATQLIFHYASEVTCGTAHCEATTMCSNPLPADPEHGVCCPRCPPGE